MIRDDDDVQERAVAEQWQRTLERRAERRQDRVVLAREVGAHLTLYVLCLALLASVVVAWRATGDERFGWAFGLIGGGVVVAYMSGMRGPK